jgi:tetratricopeptide (TPR) repeat protein
MKPKTRKQRYQEIVSADDNELNSCVIELAEKYLKDFPDSYGAWLMLSRAFQNTDRFKKARKALIETMKLIGESDDGFSWLLCNMGRIYEDSGYFHKALEWFKKAHEQNNSEATFLIYQGIIFLRTEKFDEAAEILDKATNCKEGCIEEAFYNLGVARIAQRNYQEAQKCFEKALEIDPKYKEAKQQLKDVKKVLKIP